MDLFKIYRTDGRIVVKIIGITMRFKTPSLDRLRDCCCISNLDYLLKQGTKFPHPIGIVIHPDVTIGKNCSIYQNVTIGGPKDNKKDKYRVAQIGDNVSIFPNSCIIGPVKIGDNSIVGAGSIVVKDIPANSVVVGNPAKIIKQRN